MTAIEKIIPTFFNRTCSYITNIKKAVPNHNITDTTPFEELKGKSRSSKKLGMLSAYVNVESFTGIPHTEKDISPTVISVPKQDNHEQLGINFQFCLTTDRSLFIKMKPNVTFTYSAYLLTHRQNHDGGQNCINVSAYGNQRLFWNTRKSLSRLEKQSSA